MPKPLKKKPKAKDANEAAFASVQRIIQIAEPETAQSFDAQYRAHMSELGRKGGRIGGKRRLETMTAENRREVAAKAARAMWSKRRAAEKKR